MKKYTFTVEVTADPDEIDTDGFVNEMQDFINNEYGLENEVTLKDEIDVPNAD